MNDPVLSIVVVFCDKDVDFIPGLLKKIKANVEVSHEVLLMDNREERKNFKFFPNGAKIIDMVENMFQFAARRKAIDYVRGEYVWFVDADDWVLPVTKKRDLPVLEEGYDVYAFNCGIFGNDMLSKKGSMFKNIAYGKGELNGKNEIMSDNIPSLLFQAMWNKWIKRSVMKKIAKVVPEGIKAVHLEDALLVALVAKYCRSVKFLQTAYYITNEYRSFSRKGSREEGEKPGIEWTKRFLTGQDKIRELFDTLFTEEEKAYVSLDAPGSLQYILSLIVENVREEDWEESYRLVQKYYTYEECRAGANFTDVLFKERKDDIRRLMKFENRTGTKDYGTTLSIITILYDKNVEYVRTLPQRLKEKVHVPYEFIIVDNRNETKTEEFDAGDSTIVDANGNSGIVEGRRLGVFAARNKYVWFVDGDDDVLDTWDVDTRDSEMVCFSYEVLYPNGIKMAIIKREGYISENLEISKVVFRTSVFLWAKWIRTDFARSVYEKLPKGFIIYNEDTIFLYTALRMIKGIRFVSDMIYLYRQNEDSTVAKKMIFELKSYETMLSGFDTAEKYKAENFGGLYKSCECYSDVFYLFQLTKTIDELKPYAWNYMVSLYGKERLKKSFFYIKERWEKGRFSELFVDQIQGVLGELDEDFKEKEES